MADTKTCPKCSKDMRPSPYVLTIPALNEPMGQGPPISSRAGMPVAAYQCLGCNFVELYYQD